jgi:hypothetical protein
MQQRHRIRPAGHGDEDPVMIRDQTMAMNEIFNLTADKH